MQPHVSQANGLRGRVAPPALPRALLTPAPFAPPTARSGARRDSGDRLRSGPRTSATAATSHANEAVQVIEGLVRQQQPHDSLLKSGSASFWSYMDSVASDNGPQAMRSLASAVSAIPDVPFAVRDTLSRLSGHLSSLVGAPSPASNTLASLRSAADSAWQAILSSNLLGSAMQSQPFPRGLFAGGAGAPQLPDLSSLNLAGMLFDGRFSESEVAAIAAAVVAVCALATIRADVASAKIDATASDAELPTEYDQEAIYAYWATRPTTLFKRSIQTMALGAGFLVGLQLDRTFGRVQENERLRARMLREAVDLLGPAYIKVAQALSTRVDLLSAAYFEEIQLLQDRVQPFPNIEAMAILEQELGVPPAQIFSAISPSSVAAASLGQVYRATLRATGEEVAIKVQRPGVLELVALDLLLMRRGIEVTGRIFPDLVRSADILPLLDEWAVKFFREMDYRKEAAMMRRFEADLRELQGVLVPRPYEAHTTRRVLCAQWIEGEKLSDSNADDVRGLCTTLLNAYLIQLLDTGLLHADPHPGNLIRTPDGRICILDYGLVTEVPPKFRVYILEYMAHLSLRDWRAVGDDFVKMQFVAEGSKHPNDVPGLMDSVGALLDILMMGGGAANLDRIQSKELVDMVGLDPAALEDVGFMDGFATVLDNLANPSAVDGDTALDRERAQKIRMLNQQVKFRLPEYFVFILRAFSVIEGIALKVDPQYSIINETFPYLSRRLLTDDNEEVRRALRQVLYGNGARMDLSRFQTLFTSLQAFSTDGLTQAPALAGTGPAAVPRAAATALQPEASTSAPAAAVDKNTLLALQSILSTSGSSYIQQLLVAELAATLESLSRGAAVVLLQRALQSSLTGGTLAALESLGPLRRVVFPWPLPAEVITRLGDVVTLTEEDRIAIANVQTMWGLLQPQLSAQVGPGNLQLSLLRSFAATVQAVPRETRSALFAGAGRTSQMVVELVVQRTAARFAQDLAGLRGQQAAVDDIMDGQRRPTPPARTTPGPASRKAPSGSSLPAGASAFAGKPGGARP